MKLYLAAFETQFNSYKVELPLDANFFCTYFYEKQTNKSLEHLKKIGHKGTITIDSGAHSFFGISGKKKEIPDPDVYFKAYTAWAKQWHNHFDYFCELDIQDLIGLPRVKEWRRQINAIGLGKQMITVYHSKDSWQDFVELCETSESKYIAMEGVRHDHDPITYNRFIKYAYERGIKVHGFAFTRAQLLRTYPFYSIDSSSWTTPIRYGVFQKNDGIRMISIPPDQKKFLQYGAPIWMHNSLRDTQAQKRKLEWQASEYIKLGKNLTKFWESRGIKWTD